MTHTTVEPTPPGVPTIAVVGSGPSGCYAAQHARKLWPHAEISILDRSPVPYGLVRSGVASDHQGTKSISDQFDRLFTRSGVQFFGNVAVERDISLQSVRDVFDVVIIATGSSSDRELDVPGSGLSGVYPAGKVVGHFNTVPGCSDDIPELGRRVAIIGNGNVALDLVRMLIKSAEDLDGSDLSEEHRTTLLTEPVEIIEVIGRSPLDASKFDPAMVRELGRVARARFVVDGLEDVDAAQCSVGQAFRTIVERVEVQPPEVIVHFRFGATPVRFTGTDRVDGAVVRIGDRAETVLCDSVLTAIGFDHGPQDPMATFAPRPESVGPERAELAAGLFCVGWYLTGARGGIAESRQVSRKVVDLVRSRIESGAIAVGKAGNAGLVGRTASITTDFEGWKRIDSAERMAASPNRVRRKFSTIEQLRSVAAGSDLSEPPIPVNLNI